MLSTELPTVGYRLVSGGKVVPLALGPCVARRGKEKNKETQPFLKEGKKLEDPKKLLKVN